VVDTAGRKRIRVTLRRITAGTGWFPFPRAYTAEDFLSELAQSLAD
jgi:hypothetical protein